MLMKRAQLITNKKGQSLVELMIAMAIFVLMVTAVSWLIIDSYLTNRLGQEKTTATFLAKEGLEATRSIRDNNWLGLTVGSHGLAASGGHWVFQGTQNDVSNFLRDGVRTIQVGEIDSDTMIVTSTVAWNLTQARPQQVSLVTYLTNWQKEGEEKKEKKKD